MTRQYLRAELNIWKAGINKSGCQPFHLPRQFLLGLQTLVQNQRLQEDTAPGKKKAVREMKYFDRLHFKIWMRNELELDCDQRKAHVHSHQLFFFLLADSLIFLDNGVTLQSNDQGDLFCWFYRQKLYGKSWEAKPPRLFWSIMMTLSQLTGSDRHQHSPLFAHGRIRFTSSIR